MVKCPACGQEVEYFYKKKRYDPYLRCPACGNLFTKKDLPPDAKYEVRYIEEERAEAEQPRPKVEPLFEEPKEPTEVIAEILLDWGCDEDFVRKITDYVNMKGYFDPGWLMNMLLRAKTGRRFTEQEAFMVVDMISAALQREKQRAEEAGRVFPLTIISLRGPSAAPYATPMYAPYQPPIAPYQPVPAPTPATAPTAAYQSQLTPQQIQEWIRQALQEQRRQDEIAELRRGLSDLEKKVITDKAEMEKRITESIGKLKEELSQVIREAITTLAPSQTQPPPTIDQKDIKLMLVEVEKAFSQKISELEKKYLEAKTESEKKELQRQIDELRYKLEEVRKEATSVPISPEGWQKDESRLVAELGGRFLDIVKERRPIEYLIRIIPQVQPQQPPPQPQKTEKSLEELIKEAGGQVE